MITFITSSSLSWHHHLCMMSVSNLMTLSLKMSVNSLAFFFAYSLFLFIALFFTWNVLEVVSGSLHPNSEVCIRAHISTEKKKTFTLFFAYKSLARSLKKSAATQYLHTNPLPCWASHSVVAPKAHYYHTNRQIYLTTGFLSPCTYSSLLPCERHWNAAARVIKAASNRWSRPDIFLRDDTQPIQIEWSSHSLSR